MAAEVWTAVISLGGVAIGGGLSYVVQHTTLRSAARTEAQRLEVTRAESRRTERMAQLQRFVEVAAEAERCAFNRPDGWTDGEEWPTVAHAVMYRFWVAERMIRILFPIAVHDASRAYFLILNRAVWEGLEEGEALREILEAPRLAFLDAARDALD